MDKDYINDELWDYTICLENAIRIIHKKSEYVDPLHSDKKFDERVLMDKEVEVLTRVESDLKRIINDANNKTYWDYLNVGEDDE